ncbi:MULTISPECIES: tRNA (guanosine(46)-N7)-methyltransferase TrmB [Rhodoplanes]|uniref:tRNA (guanosine(46)-N7)-methyltransferase TrmB n=1 Tax=Rhodoplanes TaxID=29407 RepID=UPI00352213EA
MEPLSLDPNPTPARAFFGRRKGHTLRRHHTDLLDALLPRLALDVSRPAPPRLGDLFDPPAREVRLEIGFGGGEHLAAQAAGAPETGFIGCEGFVNGVAQLLAHVEPAGLSNIRIHHGDAAEVLAWLPEASLARVDLLYPDPWRKRRHWKRRFVQDETVATLARLLADGGEFRFATDWEHYAAWTLEHLMRSPDFEWTAERAADWREPWAGWTRTRYEAKAIREGRRPCYLVFRRRPRG